MKKPIHISRLTGKLTGREAVWTIIRQLGQFSIIDIELKAESLKDCDKVNRETIRTYITGLEAAGYIERLPRAKNVRSRLNWNLIKDIGVHAPRVNKKGESSNQGSNREQMWRTMRILSDFSALDLVAVASTEQVQINEVDAKNYLIHLNKAGYLKVLSLASNGGGLTRYKLLPSMNTGPKPPMVQRIKQVFDPNLNMVMWPKDGE